jgi:hypothetical protein
LEYLILPGDRISSKVFLPAAWLLAGFLLSAKCHSQDDKALEELVKLPELTAYKLPHDEFLIFNARVGRANAEFIRSLRRVPAVHPEGVPTSLIIERYLHKKALAVESDACYIESDWIAVEELAKLAAVVKKTTQVTQELVKNTEKRPVKLVLLRRQEDYYALVDAWANSDKLKKQARHAASVFIEEHRCGYRGQLLEALTLASADAVSGNLEPHIWNQTALSEGLHTYLTSLLVLGYEHYISLDATTPAANREAGVRLLLETARAYLSRPKRDSLETVLRAELNDLNPERLAVAFAVVHFFLGSHGDKWEAFLSILKKESYDKRKLKGPEGRWDALVQAIKVAFGLGIPDLERELQDFTSKHYLYTEEIATLIGIDRECDESSFQGFVTICELKRLKKPVSEKGEKLYQEILGRMEKKLQLGSEKF